MLRTADKRLWVSGQLSEVMGGRRTFLPSYLRTASGPPVLGYGYWYDAADTSTLTVSGGLVSAWADKSANARNVSASGTTRPTYTRTLNGVVVPEWVDTDDQLGGPGGSTYMSDMTQTLFMVGLCDNIAGAARTLIGGTSDGGYQLRISQVNGQLVLLRQATATFFASTLGVVAGTAFQVTVAVNTTTAEIRLNGSSQSGAGSGTFGLANFILGKRGTSTGETFDGLIAEVIWYDSVLSSGDITAVEGYLKGKWGTP